MTGPAPTVVLTGATGFIGAAVLEELLRRGGRPFVLVRAASDLSRIVHLTGYETVSYTKLDDAALVAQLSDWHPTTLIHCAWRGVAGRERNEAFQITDNLPLAVDSVTLAAACGCRQWIGLGSQAEYGNLNRVISEDAVTVPTTTYGKAKLAAGLAALALCEATGLAGAWLRVFSTYGPGDHAHWMIPFVIREFLNGRAPQVTHCEQAWDYLYVADAARAIVKLAETCTSGVFNLGSGQAWPLKQIIEKIRSELHTPIEPGYGAIPYRHDQVMHLQADITKLSRATGWWPQVDLSDGLRQTVSWEKKLMDHSHLEDALT